MNRQHYLDAIETVLAWDLPEEAFTNAINHQITYNFNHEEKDVWDHFQNSSLTFSH